MIQHIWATLNSPLKLTELGCYHLICVTNWNYGTFMICPRVFALKISKCKWNGLVTKIDGIDECAQTVTGIAIKSSGDYLCVK